MVAEGAAAAEGAGATPKGNGLLAAVNEGDEASVGKMLGERRAEVDMIDSGGATPLMLACHQGNPQLGEWRDREVTVGSCLVLTIRQSRS